MDGFNDFVVLDYDNNYKPGIFLNSQTIKKMSIDSGETIVLKGANKRESTWKMYPDDKVPILSIGLSSLIQNLVQVCVGEFVSIVNGTSNKWEAKIKKELNYRLPQGAIKPAWRKVWFFDRGYYMD